MTLGWLLAHGVGGRRDLPISKFTASWAGGSALVITFLLLYLLWHTPQLRRVAQGRVIGATTPSTIIIAVLRVVALVLYLTVLAALWFGSSISNIAPVTIYVWLWVAVPFLSLFFGDVWQALNPFDTLAGLVSFARTRRITRMPAAAPDDGTIETSMWPAAIGLVGFQWLELCYHARAEIHPLALITTGYSLYVFAMTARYGRAWLRTGESFAALFGLIAAMAPVHRDADGRVRLRAPFVGLADVAPRAGTAAVVLAVLGGTTFDGFSRTRFWQKTLGSTTGWSFTGVNTLGLVWIIALVAIVYVIAAYVMAMLSDEDRNEAPGLFAYTLIPIVFAYAVAHYFTFVLYEGQDFFRLASDPLGKNWDLFGTTNYLIHYGLISDRAVGWGKAGAVVVGHIIGVALAHDRALETQPHERATIGQLPMLVAMIGYTVTALVLLLS